MGAEVSLSSGDAAEEVADHLASLGKAYESYRPICIENGIDGSQLCDLCDEDLAEYGVSVTPHRKRILKRIKAAGMISFESQSSKALVLLTHVYRCSLCFSSPFAFERCFAGFERERFGPG
jgi:hypothetical protein